MLGISLSSRLAPLQIKNLADKGPIHLFSPLDKVQMNFSNDNKSQTAWSYNSIFEESAETQEALSAVNTSAPLSDATQTSDVTNNEFIMLNRESTTVNNFNCSGQVLSSSPDCSKRHEIDKSQVDENETQLDISPPVIRNMEMNCSAIRETQEESFNTDIIDNSYLRDEDSIDFLACSQVTSASTLTAYKEPGNVIKNNNQVPEEEMDVCETQLAPSTMMKINESVIDETQLLPEEKYQLNKAGDTREIPVTESTPLKSCIHEEPDFQDETISDIESGNASVLNSDYDDLFESQSKLTPFSVSTPEKSDELSILRDNYVSPESVTINDYSSPAFVIPTEANILSRKRSLFEKQAVEETPSSSQTWGLTQLTQDTEPLSLQLPSTQIFDTTTRMLDTKSSRPHFELLTQMTQDSEPLSLQFPSTQEFETKTKMLDTKSSRPNFELLTQMTQDSEPLSLQLPSTQIFDTTTRMLDTKLSQSNSELLTQMTQDSEPLSLQFPSTQEFETKTKMLETKSSRPNFELLTQMTQDSEPLSLQFPSTQEFERKIHGAETDTEPLAKKCNVREQIFIALTELTPKVKPLSLQFQDTNDPQCPMLDVGKQVVREGHAQETQGLPSSSPPTSNVKAQNSTKQDSLQLFENRKCRTKKRPVDETAKMSSSPKLIKTEKRASSRITKNHHNQDESQFKLQTTKVAFSNNGNALKRVVEKLGCTITGIEDANVFVCDCYRMTRKMQIALDKKIPVVSSKWLTNSEKLQSLQSTDLYTLQDTRKRKDFK